jgi:hypothetical protein
MAMSNLIRWGAIGAIIGGAVIFIAGGILSTPVFSGENPSWYQQNPLWYLVEAAGKTALLVGLVGLYLYLRGSPRFGWLGTVGFYLLIVITTFEVILALMALASGPAAESVDSYVGPLRELGKIFGVLLFGLAFMILGYGLWSHRSEPIQPARSAPVR